LYVGCTERDTSRSNVRDAREFPRTERPMLAEKPAFSGISVPAPTPSRERSPLCISVPAQSPLRERSQPPSGGRRANPPTASDQRAERAAPKEPVRTPEGQ
jgi:hypothetical protein